MRPLQILTMALEPGCHTVQKYGPTHSLFSRRPRQRKQSSFLLVAVALKGVHNTLVLLFCFVLCQSMASAALLSTDKGLLVSLYQPGINLPDLRRWVNPVLLMVRNSPEKAFTSSLHPAEQRKSQNKSIFGCPRTRPETATSYTTIRIKVCLPSALLFLQGRRSGILKASTNQVIENNLRAFLSRNPTFI